MSKARTCVLLLLLACGCGNETEFDGVSAPASGDAGTPALLTVIKPEPVGSTCAFAGQRTLVGLDTNDNAVLEPAEVLTATVVCNGSGVEVPVDGCPSRETRQLPPLEASWHHSLKVIGPGFIPLKGSGEEHRASYYTRKLLVRLDKLGCLSAGEELRVQGHEFDRGVVTSNVLSDICIRPPFLSVVPTSIAFFHVNLDANSTVPRVAFDPSSPASTSNFPSSVTVFDSLGNGHQLTVYFAKTSAKDWEWHATTDGGDLGYTRGTPAEGASGTLRFSADGALESETEWASSWLFEGTSAAQHITFDFGGAIVDGGNGLEGTTNFASPSTTNSAKQDGYTAGSLMGIRVSDIGVFSGSYTNGQSIAMAQIPIASFPLADGLVRACNDLWVATPTSGEVTLGLPGTYDRGSFLPIVD